MRINLNRLDLTHELLQECDVQFVSDRVTDKS